MLSPLRTLIALGLIGFSLWVCEEKGHQEKTREELYDQSEKNKIILRIENSFYTHSDFKHYLLLTLGEGYEEMSDLSLSRLLDSFIEEKLLLEAARARGIFLTNDEKKGYISKLSNELNISESIIKKEIDIDTLLEKLLIEKFTLGLVNEIKVTSEEILEYYHSNKKEFLQREQRRVSQILLETEEKAIEIYKKLKGATDEDFRKIAKQESEGIESSRGGMMGLFELGQLPKEMDEVVFSLKQGETSQVIESEYGYHIFRVNEIIKSAPLPEKPDKETSSKIEIKILNQEINEFMSKYLEKLKSGLEWNFYPDRIGFSYQRNGYEQNQ